MVGCKNRYNTVGGKGTVIWYEVTDTSRLQTELVKAEQRDKENIVLAQRDKEKAKEKELQQRERERKRQAMKDTPFMKRKGVRICAWIIMGIMILCIVVLTIMHGVEQRNIEYLNSIADTRLLEYENGIYEVKKIGYLYNIYDDVSYREAKSKVRMSAELTEQFFPTKTYKGNAQAGKVRIDDIRYELDKEADDYIRYLVYLTRETEQGTTAHRLIAVYNKSGILIDLIDLN